MFKHTSEWVFPEVHMLLEIIWNVFFIPNFLNSSRTSYAQLFIFVLKYTPTSIFRQFFFKICKTDFTIFFKIPIFDIFINIQKAPLQIFVLTCKNVYFDPKFNCPEIFWGTPVGLYGGGFCNE